MRNAPSGWISGVLSSARLVPYLRLTEDSLSAALCLYWYNVQVSAAFYGPLHCLEIGLRNSLHERLQIMYGRDDWWAVAPLAFNGRRQVEDARCKFRKNGAASPTTDDMVAELTFGFWVSLLSSRYDRALWIPGLHLAFPNYRGPRKHLHRDLDYMRGFRNRIMHYEPIHHRRLEQDHATILRLLGYLSNDFAEVVRALDRVPDVLSRRAELKDDGFRPTF